MAVEGKAISDTVVTAGDLRLLQYTFVKLDSTGKAVAVAAATDIPYGVLQNTPNTGQMADIVVLGETKLKFGASINGGVLIGTTNAGLAVALAAGTDVTKYILGQVKFNPGGAYVGTAQVNCIAPSRAA